MSVKLEFFLFSFVFLIKLAIYPVHSLTPQEYKAFKGKDLSTLSPATLNRICNNAAKKIDRSGTDYKATLQECTIQIGLTPDDNVTEKLARCVSKTNGDFFIGKGQSKFGVYYYTCMGGSGLSASSLSCNPKQNVAGPL